MPILPSSPCLAAALALAMAPAPAHADCIDDAADRHHVNALVLRAIGWQESRLQPQALGRNANGSVDVGAFQINSIHLAELARHGIDRARLADGCVSAEVAAWHYRRQVERQGDTWSAVGAYHSHTLARAAGYANRIASILMRWKALPDGPLPFPAERAPAPTAPDRPAGRSGPLPPATTPAAPPAVARSEAPGRTPLALEPSVAPGRAPLALAPLAPAPTVAPGRAPPPDVTVLAFAPSAR